MNLEKVTIFNIKHLRRIFNINQNSYSLDDDFFYVYDRESFIYKFLLRKQLKLIKLGKNFIGYIWFSFSTQSGVYSIYGIDINDKYINLISNDIFNSLKFNVLTYECADTQKNNLLMENLNFKKTSASILMSIKTSKRNANDTNIKFVKFKKGQDERKRCIIQNNIFERKGRVPITIADIEEEQNSSYYIDGLAFFMIVDNICIGYGQIIMSHGVHTIVNFGIIKEYRKSGYGSKFIDFLVDYCFKKSIEKLNIRVEDTNIAAVNLYKNTGFIENFRISKWQCCNF